MALQVEGVVDGGMEAEKSLRGSGRLEPLHFALSSSYDLMRVLGTIVHAPPLLVPAGQAKSPERSGVGGQLIGDRQLRRKALLPEQLAHQPLGCPFVPARLDQDVEDLTLLIDSSPQIHSPAPDREHHLVHVPPARWSGSQSAQVAGEGGSKLQDPAPDGFVGNRDAAFGQEFLDVTVAQREPEIQPNGMPDDLGWELMAGIGDGLHARALPLDHPLCQPLV